MACLLHLFNTTLSKAFPTSFPGTAKAISSTQVTCRAWAAGLGNSLNLQSQLGKGPGDFPAMGEVKAKEDKQSPEEKTAFMEARMFYLFHF